jgi:hypothetical protein
MASLPARRIEILRAGAQSPRRHPDTRRGHARRGYPRGRVREQRTTPLLHRAARTSSFDSAVLSSCTNERPSADLRYVVNLFEEIGRISQTSSAFNLA